MLRRPAWLASRAGDGHAWVVPVRAAVARMRGRGVRAVRRPPTRWRRQRGRRRALSAGPPPGRYAHRRLLCQGGFIGNVRPYPVPARGRIVADVAACATAPVPGSGGRPPPRQQVFS